METVTENYKPASASAYQVHIIINIMVSNLEPCKKLTESMKQRESHFIYDKVPLTNTQSLLTTTHKSFPRNPHSALNSTGNPRKTDNTSLALRIAHKNKPTFILIRWFIWKRSISAVYEVVLTVINYKKWGHPHHSQFIKLILYWWGPPQSPHPWSYDKIHMPSCFPVSFNSDRH